MKRYAFIIAVLLGLVAVSAFANFVVYHIYWEQNETEWIDISTYGQEHDVYITFESSFQPTRTFRIPSEFAGVLAAQINQAAIDSNAHDHQEPFTEVE